MKKVSVIGHFAFGLQYLDGQTIKTKNLTNELIKLYGRENVISFDTHGSLKTLLKSPISVIKALKKSKNVIMIPAHNGLRIFGRLLPFFKKFFKGRKIYYVVVGGWLSKKLEKNKSLKRALKKFDGIFVETYTLERELIKQGFTNVSVAFNFKDLTPVSKDELVWCDTSQLKLCTFSRVMEEKGIELAVDAVKAVNKKLGYEAYTLDIYGQVDESQKEWFEILINKFDTSINYMGCVESSESVKVLKNYFALLFPTRFYTEGVPGTIIDAYAAGVPVISAKWESFADVVDDGITGIGYEFNNVLDLQQKLIDIAKEPSILNKLKTNCLGKSIFYTPSVAIKPIIDSFV